MAAFGVDMAVHDCRALIQCPLTSIFPLLP
jgi:hypothetical protein